MVYYTLQDFTLGVISVCFTIMLIVFDALIVITLFADVLLDLRISLGKMTRFLNYKQISYCFSRTIMRFSKSIEFSFKMAVLLQCSQIKRRSGKDQQNCLAWSKSLLNDTSKDTATKALY